MINHRNELDFLTIMVNLLLKEKIINLSLVIMTDKSQLKVKQFYLLLIKKTLLSFVIILSLAACDNSTYNELFRNPYIVEVVEANSINADKWYEFATKAEAYNKNNEIHISFDGSEPEKMTFQTVDFHAETNPFGTPEYISTAFPEDKIIFDVKAMDIDDIEYDFTAVGQGGGIIFEYDKSSPLIGKTIKGIWIKSNLDHENVKVTWVSRTGK